MHLALRATLPIRKTTLNAVLHRESGISPARALLEGNRLRMVIRINTLYDRHPLRSQASVCLIVVKLYIKRKQDYESGQRHSRVYSEFTGSFHPP